MSECMWLCVCLCGARVYVCVCVYTCMCMRVYVYVCLYVLYVACLCVRMRYACLHACTYVCACVCTYTCMCVRVSLLAYVVRVCCCDHISQSRSSKNMLCKHVVHDAGLQIARTRAKGVNTASLKAGVLHRDTSSRQVQCHGSFQSINYWHMEHNPSVKLVVCGSFVTRCTAS